MIAWMLYAMLVGVLLGWAALLAERGLRTYRRAGRLPWVIALAGSAGLPVAMAFLRQAAPVTSDSEPIVVLGGSEVMRVPVAAIERVGAAAVSLDLVLLALWTIVSLVLLAWVGWSWWLLRRERASWSIETVDGHRVFVSADVGPAVLDPVAGGVVVPRWLLTATPAERHIALRHELEHIRASDHRVLWAALLVPVVFPWNVALWWQLRRLRHAVELDCDRRVLEGGIAASSYAELLFRVVGSGPPRRLRPALTEQPSFLRWRIAAMIHQRVRYRLARAVAYGAVAAALVFLACETRAPEAPAEQGAPAADPTSPGDEPVYAGSALDATPERVSCPPLDYPRLMRQAGIEGEVLLHFVVESDGTIDSATIEVLESSHRAFEEPARRLIAGCRFRPARVDATPVRALVQMPVTFRVQQGVVRDDTEPGAAGRGGIQITTVLPPTTAGGTMRGTVYAPDGRPLAGARIVFVGRSFSAATDARGGYTIDVPAGSYAIRAESERFQAVQMNGVRIQPGETLTADFRLAQIR